MSVYEHEIRVGWGDCDPARIAYTGRLPWFALEAINGWWEEKLGGGWYQMELDRKIGTPFVKLGMEFFSPVTPRHRLVCSVWPSRLGTTSITFRVEGRQDGTLCFAGDFTSVFTDAVKFVKAPPPEEIRALVEAHLRPAGD
ncbi:acyl-CoA thioesterase [Rhodovulum sp. DZ06]|uniref:acyl-CoA thioesterase n=1 Tax=Rhodovulum sp. DZ06 TaxID=3425126 RepID=UPI003D34E8EA